MSDLNHTIAAAEKALQARQRQVNEERFTTDLEAYLTTEPEMRIYTFGGPVNLLTTCADILRKHDRHDEADIFDKAAREIER